MVHRLLPLLLLAAVACSPTPPPQPSQYPLTGQVLAVHLDRNELTVKHDEIPGFMMAMTMTFPAEREVVLDLTPGDLISATLEVLDGQARLLDVKRTGSAPLPGNTNEIALAAGLLEVGDAVPDAALIDQTDRRRSLAEWTGTPTLYGFTYTTCPLPNYCPLIDRNFARLQEAIAADDTLRGRVRLVTITIDPSHDTPDVLARHAEVLGADPAVWTFLTGDPATVDRVAGRFGVGIVRPDEPGGEIRHNLRTTLVGADGHVLEIYSGNDWSIETVLGAMRRAVN